MRKPFYTRLDEKVRDDLGDVANGVRLDSQEYAQVALNTLSKLKPEFALHALTSIPKEYFRPGPGRPPASATRADADVAKLTG